MESRVYATFTKKNDRIYRTDTYMQFGQSDDIIGACVLCNPGGSKLKNKRLQAELEASEANELAKCEVTRDDTMKQLEQILTKMCGENLEGRFMIYNLFALRNTDMKQAVQLLDSTMNDQELMLKDFNDFQAHAHDLPWLLIGWGCEKNNPLNQLKKSWLREIKQKNISYIGIEGKEHPHYYHPLPQIYSKRVEYVEQIVEQYRSVIGFKKTKSEIIKFPVIATQRNILVESCKEELEFDRTGWAIESKGPENIVKGYSNIFLKEEYKLVACHYRDGLGGQAYVWAVPKISEVSLLKNFITIIQEFSTIPRPEDALEHFMMAIDGDRSPLSYLQAAVLIHELWEYGAYWHSVDWGEDIILPIDLKDSKAQSSREWTMEEEEPDIIHPHFYYDEDQNPVVVFHTINRIAQVTWKEYKHIFSKEDYSMKVECKVIATAGIGILF